MRDPFEIVKETTVADTYDGARRILRGQIGQRVINGLSFVGEGEFFGRAVTMRSLPARTDHIADINKTAREKYGVSSMRAAAIRECDDKSVLVVDASGYNHSAIGGSTGMSALVARGARGIVSDGAIRDRVDFKRYYQQYGFCTAVNDWTVQSGTGSALYASEIQVDIAVHGVLVRPGDYIYGNEDSVMVLPAADIVDVLECAIAVRKFDTYIVKISEEQGKIQGYDINPKSEEFRSGLFEYAQFTDYQRELYEKYVG